jgi:hypothetical protein
MNDLWEVLIPSNLAKKRGKRNIIDKDGVQQFITNNELTHAIILDEKEKQSILRIGIYTPNSLRSDHSATFQWKSQNNPPLPLRNAALEFRRDLAIYNSKKLPVPIVSRKRIHHDAGVSNTTILPSESAPPPNIQEKALSIIKKSEISKEECDYRCGCCANFFYKYRFLFIHNIYGVSQ